MNTDDIVTSESKILFTKTSETSKQPLHSPYGYICYAVTNVSIKAFQPTIVPLGFKFQIHKKYCGVITNYKETVLAGIIDSDYRGEVAAILVANKDVLVNKNEPVAYLQILEIVHPVIIEAYQEALIETNKF